MNKDKQEQARKELLIRMAKHKQICKCGHPIDLHLESILGECIAGECSQCECEKYDEVVEKLK